MRFLVVGDLHGALPKIRFTGFDAIIAPGDFCSSDGIRRYLFESIRTGEHWYDIVGKAKARKLVGQAIRDGRKVLEHLDKQGVPVYIIPGNTDMTGYDTDWKLLRTNHYAKMRRGLKNIKDIDEKFKALKECCLIGYGRVGWPEYPQIKKEREKYSQKKLRELRVQNRKSMTKMNALFARAKMTRKPIVYLTHNMPYGRFDKVLDKSSPRYGQHVGSVISRDLIKKHTPLLAIGGHMHEYFGKTKLGTTTVIDAGYGPRVNTLVEIEDGEVKRIEFKK